MISGEEHFFQITNATTSKWDMTLRLIRYEIGNIKDWTRLVQYLLQYETVLTRKHTTKSELAFQASTGSRTAAGTSHGKTVCSHCIIHGYSKEMCWEMDSVLRTCQLRKTYRPPRGSESWSRARGSQLSDTTESNSTHTDRVGTI